MLARKNEVVHVKLIWKLEIVGRNTLSGNSESLAEEETYPYITSWSESLDCIRI
jgi:hypothetical protein